MRSRLAAESNQIDRSKRDIYSIYIRDIHIMILCCHSFIRSHNVKMSFNENDFAREKKFSCTPPLLQFIIICSIP